MGHLLRKPTALRRAPSGNPTDSAAQRIHRTRQILNTTLSCRNAATNPQTLQQSPTAHVHSPPAGPYAPNRATPPRGALTICVDSRPLRTGRVPGQPGLARPPAP